MLVQIAFKYTINLSRVLYTEFDSDLEEQMKVVFDNGEILLLKGKNEIDSFDKHILHNDMASQE